MHIDSHASNKTKPTFSLHSACPPPYNNKAFEVKALKRKAFTLAETLITLSIIGVIAAMTVPTLMSNIDKQTYVTGAKKAYSQLQNTTKM
ncbi:type II secretion system protein, partial [bacterium]|nr:type II secretion system protein [bacterium]